METTELQLNLLVQDGRELLKVSEIYSQDRVSAQVLYPMPPRTTVRYYSARQVAGWREPTNQLVAQYEKAWGFRSTPTVPVKRCESETTRGICDRPLDVRGYCDSPRDHLDG